ncbi:conserved Plasmodium protein, unknown function [Plasmodium sp. gorilla clade G1]|nr:conserved Plasmodium protein, unknown function [Plasmodium sp. gorilla clade G1]
MTKGGSNHKNNKIKPIDINKKLLIIKCNDDIRKLINKESPSVDEINEIKNLLENNEVKIEKKKRNIVIPRFKICEDSEEEKNIKSKDTINNDEKRKDNINDDEKRKDNINNDAEKNKSLSDDNNNNNNNNKNNYDYDNDDEKKYSITKFEKPSHYIRYELYKDQVTGIKLSDGSIIHYDLLKEDEIFLEGLNSYLNIHVNDESFSKLIDKFEKLTGNSDNKEEINFKEALKAASDLKINYKSNVIKDIYTYWKNKRKKLGRPLLRMFWNNSQNSLPHYSVFRPRVKEKMTLRKHKKKNSEIIIKMQELIQDFRRLDRILRKIKQRDEKKLLLLQLNAILFDQRINEIQDKTYVCPMWNYFKDYKIEKIYKKFKKDKYYKNSYHHHYINNSNNNKYYYDEKEYENYNIDANEDGYVNHNYMDEYMNDNMDEYLNNNIDAHSHYNYRDSIYNRKINKKLKHYIIHPEQKNLLKINPSEYKNVVLIKRRGRSNRMWVDRKYVDENNINNHEINYCDLSYAFNDFVEASLTLKKNYEEDVSNYLSGRTRIPIKLDIRKRDLKNVGDFNTSLFCNNQIHDDSLFNGMYDELNGERKRKRRKKKEQENLNVDENYINSNILLDNMGDQFALQANNNIHLDKTKASLNDNNNNNIIICNNNLDIIQKNSTTNVNVDSSNMNTTNIVTCDRTSITNDHDANNTDIKLNYFINKGNKINMNEPDYNTNLLFHKNNTEENMLNQYIQNKNNLYNINNINNINSNIKINEDNTKMVSHNILSLEHQNFKNQDFYEKYVSTNITNNYNNNNNNNNNNNIPYPLVSRNDKYAPCIFSKEQNNKTIFHFEDMIDPLMNKDNYLFCLSKYVYVQKKILFYLEHLLNFDNYNFKSKKKELPNNKDMNINLKINTNDNINNDSLNNDNINKDNINCDDINNKKNDDLINNTLSELNGTCLKSKVPHKSVKHKTAKDNNIK